MTASLITPRFGPVYPVLRMYDLDSTRRFYLDYLGCVIDWQGGGGDAPVYLQVSRGDLVLHLSSHHDDGTPGSAVLVEIDDVERLHDELGRRDYPFQNPALEPGPGEGRQLQLIDPASNRLRFYERPRPVA
jgi:ribosomal-protein-alanine N-acetyltransferase